MLKTPTAPIEALEMTFNPVLAGASVAEVGPFGAVDPVPAVVWATDRIDVGVAKGWAEEIVVIGEEESLRFSRDEIRVNRNRGSWRHTIYDDTHQC
jgi:hypothetical protein